ncbi:MAG: carboxypeptidase regulatory-like domain-containing protein [Acidobacteria bacterium]|nr:carboxypeptidase regulatory-like domain-containing protein [Acidobacteriota bacterium]
MKKTIVVTALLLLFSALVLASPPPQFGSRPKADNTRLLTGKVLDRGDSPLPNAVVYLTNTRTRAVKTYIVSQDGSYRFPALQPNLDYEVYAQHNGHKSDVKTVSQFDDRSQVSINLKIDAK